MSEHTPPVYNKFYSSDKFLYLFKNKYGSEGLVLEDRKIYPGKLFLIVLGERHAPGTTQQTWFMKVVFGENIGWISVAKDWTWDLKTVKVVFDET